MVVQGIVFFLFVFLLLCTLLHHFVYSLVPVVGLAKLPNGRSFTVCEKALICVVISLNLTPSQVELFKFRLTNTLPGTSIKKRFVVDGRTSLTFIALEDKRIGKRPHSFALLRDSTEVIFAAPDSVSLDVWEAKLQNRVSRAPSATASVSTGGWGTREQLMSGTASFDQHASHSAHVASYQGLSDDQARSQREKEVESEDAYLMGISSGLTKLKMIGERQKREIEKQHTILSVVSTQMDNADNAFKVNCKAIDKIS